MKIQSFSVTDVVSQIKLTLESNFRALVVEGEISNLSPSAAGHWYFTLSDKNSSISCALFKMDAYRNPIIKKIKNGDKVLITGPISVYAKRGTFQLLAKKIHPAGRGNLIAQYEALKEKLRIEGLFDLEEKKEIPKFPNKTVVITALKGAALQDFLNVMKRRTLWGEIVIVPAIVQGDDSAKSLREALAKAIKLSSVDVIVLTRGGGAMEDLWSFNDEQLVRDVFACHIPIISAIGHQVDYTLTDFAADLRCETPTAAAEILSQGQTELKQRLSYVAHKLKYLLYEQHSLIERKLKKLNPINLLHIVQEKVYYYKSRLSKINISNRIHELLPLQEYQMRVDENLNSMLNSISHEILDRSHRLNLAQSMLQTLNPHNVLRRGYVIVKSEKNKVVVDLKSFKTIQSQEKLKLQFADGVATVKKESEK